MILKKAFLLAITMLTVSIVTSVGQDIPVRPNPPKLVNDLAGLLSPQEVQALENKLILIDDSTSLQIAVVIVNDIQGADPNQYAYKIAQAWGVGQKGTNNGVLILIKPKTSDSKGQISIQNGYGIEAVMTDAYSRRIIENEMIPQFKENNYLQGIDAAVNAIILVSKDMYKGNPKAKKKKTSSGLAILIIIGIIIVLSSIASKNGRSKHHTMGGAGSSLPFWMLLGMMGSSGGRSSGSGWGSFSSGSGSFGGFGGGSFGGGGASGSW